MIGRVASTKLQHTATVVVERVASHPLYKKTFIRTKKYLVDDPIGVKDGDLVEIVKVRPISKNKHFRISKVRGKNLAEIVEAEQKEAAAEIIADIMPASPEGGQDGPEEKEVDRVQGISKASLSSEAINVGSSEETKETEKVEEKKKRIRKEKVAPKP